MKFFGKHIFACLLSFMVILTIANPVSAQKRADVSTTDFIGTFSAQDGYVTVFDSQDYQNMSMVDIGKAKLKDAGVSEFVINHMRNGELERAGNANFCAKNTKYFKEVLDRAPKIFPFSNKSAYQSSKMIEVSQAELTQDMRTILLDPIAVVDVFGRTICTEVPSMSDLDRNPINGPVYGHLDGGELEVDIFTIGTNSGPPSLHQTICEYTWYVMPKYRGTDYVGITSSSNIIKIAGGFNSVFVYDTRKLTVHATMNGIGVLRDEYIEGNIASLPNEASSVQEGAISKINLPGDTPLPAMMTVGQTLTGVYSIGARGAVWYTAELMYPTITPQGLDMYSAYKHQSKRIIFSGPALNMRTAGTSAAFTVTPVDKYTNLNDSMTLAWQ